MGTRATGVAAGLGLMGSLACSAAMVAALVGLFGAGAAGTAGMVGMSNTSSPPTHSNLPVPLTNAISLLIESGPVILIISVAAVAAAVGTRRRVGLLPVAVAGVVLYWGMYIQAAQLVMYASIVVGLAALAGTYFWSTRAVKNTSC